MKLRSSKYMNTLRHLERKQPGYGDEVTTKLLERYGIPNGVPIKQPFHPEGLAVHQNMIRCFRCLSTYLTIIDGSVTDKGYIVECDDCGTRTTIKHKDVD